MARRKRSQRTLKVHAVDWYDATGSTEWTTIAEAQKSAPALITTIGVILVQDELRVVIASTVGHGEDQACGDVTTVPAVWIRSIEPLGEVILYDTPPPTK